MPARACEANSRLIPGIYVPHAIIYLFGSEIELMNWICYLNHMIFYATQPQPISESKSADLGTT